MRTEIQRGRRALSLLVPHLRVRLLHYATEKRTEFPYRTAVSRGLWFALSILARRSPTALGQLLSSSRRWAKGRISHNSATITASDAIAQLKPSLNTQTEVGALRRHLGSIGLFSATSGLLPMVQPRLIPQGGPEWRRQVRLAIATCNDQYAHELACLSNLSPEMQNSPFLEYISLWVKEVPTGDFGFHVSGPGPLGKVPSSIDLAQLPTSQVIMPTASLTATANEVNGRTRLVGYANGMTTSWLRSLELKDRTRALNLFEKVRVKRFEEWMKEDSRFEECRKVSTLYLCGSPNMIPIVVIDLLSRHRTKIFVTGTSFFIGTEPYRNSARRYFPEENKISDGHGSIGGVFERCRSMAGHDQIINRAVLRNLYKAGWVSGDDLFVAGLQLDDDLYLQALDEHYGRHRK